MSPIRKTVRKYARNIALMLASAILLIWAVWQHDVLCAPRIEDFYTGVFEFFTGVRTSVNFAYNITLVLIFVAYILPYIAWYYWEDA